METEKNKYHDNKNWKRVHQSGGSGVYGIGFVGALVYYIQHSSNFTEGFFGLLKAIAWPAILVHKALTLLNL